MEAHLINSAFIFVAVVAFYAILSRGLFRVTDTFRWRALEIAEEFNRSDKVSDERKASMYRRLGEMHSALHAWKLVFFLVCVMITFPFKKEGEIDQRVPSEMRKDMGRFTVYWMISTVANSAAAAFVFCLLAMMMLAFSASISVLSKCLDLAQDHHDGHNGRRAAA